MVRRVLLFVFVLWVCALASADPKWKSISECDAGWKEWADRAMPKYQTLSQDYDTLWRENRHLKQENGELQSKAEFMSVIGTIVSVAVAAMGIGVGAFGAFVLGRLVKRSRPLSPTARQLIVLVVGGIWVSAAALIGVKDDTLSTHPVNLLFTVLVYSIPALAFGGIGFWWFGKAKPQEPTA